jgi:hypothetical protein
LRLSASLVTVQATLHERLDLGNRNNRAPANFYRAELACTDELLNQCLADADQLRAYCYAYTNSVNSRSVGAVLNAT